MHEITLNDVHFGLVLGKSFLDDCRNGGQSCDLACIPAVMPDEDFKLTVRGGLYHNGRKYAVFLDTGNHVLQSLACVKLKFMVMIRNQHIAWDLAYAVLDFLRCGEHCPKIKCTCHFLILLSSSAPMGQKCFHVLRITSSANSQ